MDVRGVICVVRLDIPADTHHQNDVVSTSMRRDHVAPTLIRRHVNVVCLLGLFLVFFSFLFLLVPRKCCVS